MPMQPLDFLESEAPLLSISRLCILEIALSSEASCHVNLLLWMLLAKQIEVQNAVDVLEDGRIEESLIEFAMNMRKYPDGDIPRWLDTLGTIIIPRALATYEKKLAFLEHLDHMLGFGGCLFQRRCVYYGLPICCLCEYRSPYYPPDYIYPLVVTSDDPPGWDRPEEYL